MALVFTYHSISNGEPPLCLAPARFAQQLDFLLQTGFEAVALSAIVDSVGQAAKAGDRRFALTFDDGYLDFAEHAWPALRERKLPATLFALGTPRRDRPAGGTGAPLLPLSMLRQLADDGVEIGAHGIDHVDLRRLSDDGLRREITGGRKLLEDAVGGAIGLFAYPFGHYDDRVRKAAARCYRAAFTTQLAGIPSEADLHALPRVDAFYLGSRGLRSALRRGEPAPYLTARRWLRRLRGSEPRRPIPRRNASTFTAPSKAHQTRYSPCP